VTLLGAKLLFSALQPGRVLAGTGVARIQGTASTAMIQLNADASLEFSLYSGAMDVITLGGAVSVQPGWSVTVRPNGRLSDIQLAKPIPIELR
jgi:hypothetical protein